MITYIQLGSKGTLDVKDEVSVPLNFSIAEIQDISKKQGSFSKSIQLVGTSNNNNLLSNLFDVNVADATFNINAKEPCQVIQNGIPIFDGYLQLLNVNKISPSSDVDEFVEYTVQINAGTGTLYASMQEDLLEDLPLWEQYNHIYTLSAITATSAHTVSDGYTYFLPLKAESAYGVTDFAPSIYAKQYWDRIFLVNNFTYEWDSIDSVGFNDLIIPYNSDTPRADTANNFRAGFLTGSTLEFVITGDSQSFYITENKIIFDDDVTPPNYNQFTSYDSTTGDFTSNFINTIYFKTKYKYSVDFIVPVNCIYKAGNSNVRLTVELINSFKKTSGASELIIDNYLNEFVLAEVDAFDQETISAGTYNITTLTTPVISALFDTEPNDVVELFLKVFYSTDGSWFENDGVTPLAAANTPRTEINLIIDPTQYENNYYIGTPTNSLSEGQTVNVQSFIPKQIKQKDFISSIIKMYNLFIVPDKYEENHLIIKTRDDFYDDGDIIDWTSKLSTERDSLLEFLPDLQDKRLILSYKDDNDEWNKQYKEDTKETYGQVEYNFDTEFTQSTKKIETIFSPTPIVINSNGLLVPAILNKNPKTNIRILQYNGWVDGEWQYGKNSPLNPSGETIFDTYPQALHLDDPINATVDINYAEPDYYFYQNYETVTNNNLYNKYWSRFINQIETGKMLTATFLLNENDIANLDLASKIWVHDNYYNINRIIDYNPNGNGLTKVELITVDEGIKFAPSSFDSTSTATTVTLQGVKHNWVTNWATVQKSQSNSLFGERVTNTLVLGGDNKIQAASNSSIVLGDNNNYQGRYGIVAGEDNNVQGNNLYVFGGSGLTVSGDSLAIFNVPVSATTISATTIFINGSDTPIEPAVWGEGTGGGINGFAIKAINNTTTDATGDYAVAQGSGTLASGLASHAEGGATEASGVAAHAEGNNTEASGDQSHAEGFLTIASGLNSHAQGDASEAIGNESHAGGRFSQARFDGEMCSNGVSTAAVGESQFGTVNILGITTNATPTNIDFTSALVAQNGFAPPVSVTSIQDVAMAFTYQASARNTATGASRIYSGEGLIKWIGGTPTLSFGVGSNGNGDAGIAAAELAPVANGLGLKFTATGIAATNIEWNIRMDYNW